MATIDNSTCGNMRKRDASMEAFRCLLMFLIVLNHAAFHGYYRDDATNWAVPLFFTILLVWHVDGFIALSGWYGVRFSLQKFFNLFGIIAFWSCIKFVVLYLYTGIPICSYAQIWSGGWYGSTYLAFMFVAPLVNAGIEKLVELDRKRMYLTWIVFNVGMGLNWAPYNCFSGVAASGGGAAFSILTFVYVYVNVRLIKLLGLEQFFNRKRLFACVVVFIAGVLLFTLPVSVVSFLREGVISKHNWLGYTSYNSPHAIAMAVGVLLLFVKYVNISGFLAKCILKISPFMFGVYIIHEGTGIGKQLFLIPEAWVAEHTGLNPLIVVLIGAIITYVAAIVMESIRHIVAKPLKHVVNSQLDRIDQVLGFRAKNY